ncbi:MAG: hypothetical protein P8175_04600 [Deltaproteobacteria bacterium]
MIQDLVKLGPLGVLEKTSHKGLGKGHLGVLIARAGVGKTACLIQIALSKLFRDQKLVHISLENAPEKVSSYYNVISSDLMKSLGTPHVANMKALIQQNRMILSFLNQSFEMRRLRENLANLAERIKFVPDTLIVDGLDFSKTSEDVFKEFQDIARTSQTEIWFSALSHKHISDMNKRGIPYPCQYVDHLFSIILQLEPSQSGILLKLLKDHGNPIVPEAYVQLDPKTFMVTA